MGWPPTPEQSRTAWPLNLTGTPCLASDCQTVSPCGRVDRHGNTLAGGPGAVSESPPAQQLSTNTTIRHKKGKHSRIAGREVEFVHAVKMSEASQAVTCQELDHPQVDVIAGIYNCP